MEHSATRRLRRLGIAASALVPAVALALAAPAAAEVAAPSAEAVPAPVEEAVASSVAETAAPSEAPVPAPEPEPVETAPISAPVEAAVSETVDAASEPVASAVEDVQAAAGEQVAGDGHVVEDVGAAAIDQVDRIAGDRDLLREAGGALPADAARRSAIPSPTKGKESRGPEAAGAPVGGTDSPAGPPTGGSPESLAGPDLSRPLTEPLLAPLDHGQAATRSAELDRSPAAASPFEELTASAGSSTTALQATAPSDSGSRGAGNPPATPTPDRPAPLFSAPGSASGAAGSSFVPLAALLALLALAAPAILRRLREAPSLGAPCPFVCALERPG